MANIENIANIEVNRVNRSHLENVVPCTIIAVTIDEKSLTGGIVSYESAYAKPEITYQTTISTDAHLGGEAVLKRVDVLVDELMGFGYAPAVAIGVGTVGEVDAETGAIITGNDLIPDWSGQQIEEYLSTRFAMPTGVLTYEQARTWGKNTWRIDREPDDCLIGAAEFAIDALVERNG